MASFLIVENDPLLCRQLESYLHKLGHSCTCSSTLQQGIERGNKQDFDIVFLDVHLPDSSGLHGIGQFRSTDSSPEVIIITDGGDSDGAKLAIRNSAWYYVEKPLEFNVVRLLVNRVLQFRETSFNTRQNVLLRRQGIIGDAPALNRGLNQLSLAAQNNGSVLITGETGTGKTLFARALHENSPRSEGPLVFLDCSKLTATNISGLLYGEDDDHSSFKAGALTKAYGGTLVLDEIGDLNGNLQQFLLQVFHDNSPPPVSSRPLTGRNDCRFVATSKRHIEAMAAKEEFRSDLFYRLASFHIEVPPLRERPNDIRVLMRHYVDSICLENRMHPKGVSMEYIEALQLHSWPGNIRELINVVQISVAAAGEEPMLYPYHLPLNIKADFFRNAGGAVYSHDSDADAESKSSGRSQTVSIPTLKLFREEAYSALEAEYLDRLITISDANVQTACKMAGISRSRLYQLLDKHDRQLKA